MLETRKATLSNRSPDRAPEAGGTLAWIRRTRWTAGCGTVGLVLLAGILYADTVKNPFIMDDAVIFERHPGCA